MPKLSFFCDAYKSSRTATAILDVVFPVLVVDLSMETRDVFVDHMNLVF